MFDTMTLTKAVGALCGSLLVFMLGAWAAQAIYHTGPTGHAADGAQAYSIDTGVAAPAAGADTDTAAAFAAAFAAADPAAGEKVFAKCRACHKVDGANGTGPHLDGVVGRAVATVPGFAYSAAMQGHGGNWDAESLEKFLANPKAATPGTKMTFAGLPKVEDRANLIAWLASVGN